jgi:hypothetical protein
MGVSITNKTIDKLLGFLFRLDVESKKRLIDKLSESVELEDENKNNLNTLFGSWVDSRDSDVIISEIRESRVDNVDRAEF